MRRSLQLNNLILYRLLLCLAVYQVASGKVLYAQSNTHLRNEQQSCGVLLRVLGRDLEARWPCSASAQ